MTRRAAGGAQPGEEPGRSAAAQTPLQRLIRDRMRERGWGYADVARMGGLSESALRTLATRPGQLRPPRPATLDALARGLDVAPAVVRAAAAESAGLYYYADARASPPRPGDQEMELLIASTEDLPPEERGYVAALVEALRRRAPGPAGG